jgi:secondary thiamine-phosphate synthase enzyme
MHTFSVTTRERNEMVEITDQVRGAVRASGAREGICVVYCPHTTGAITVNENADPDVVHDLMLWYGRVVPKQQHGFQHGEGNSDSHIKSTLVGPSATR